MEISKTDGIILKSRPSGESDISSLILTCDYGKKRFIFKGLKKSRKRSIAAVEPGSVINLLYYNHEDREFQIVSEFTQLMSFTEIRNDYDRIIGLTLQDGSVIKEQDDIEFKDSYGQLHKRKIYSIISTSEFNYKVTASSEESSSKTEDSSDASAALRSTIR